MSLTQYEPTWINRDLGESDEAFAARKRRMAQRSMLFDLFRAIDHGETKEALNILAALMEDQIAREAEGR